MFKNIMWVGTLMHAPKTYSWFFFYEVENMSIIFNYKAEIT